MPRKPWRTKSLHAPPHSSSHWPASFTHQGRVCIWLQTTHSKRILHRMASSGIPPARALLPRVTGSIKTSSRRTLSAENRVQPSTLHFSKRVISYQFGNFKRLDSASSKTWNGVGHRCWCKWHGHAKGLCECLQHGKSHLCILVRSCSFLHMHTACARACVFK